MPEQNDCKYREFARASGRPLQRPASLSKGPSPSDLLSSSRKCHASLYAISRNRSPGLPQRPLHGDAEDCKLPPLSSRQRSDPPRCQVSQLIRSSDVTAQEPPIPGFSGELVGTHRLAPLEEKLKERDELLKVAVDALQAEIGRRKALEVELEDWRMKGQMMPELLNAMTSFEALVGPRIRSENTSSLKPSSSTDTPISRGNERRKRVKI